MESKSFKELHKEQQECALKLSKQGVSTFISISNNTANEGFSIVCGDIENIQFGLVKFMIDNPSAYKIIADAVNTASSILASKSN